MDGKKLYLFFSILVLSMLSLGAVQACNSYCGNGVINSPNYYGNYEECDDGILNGNVCTPLYGESCSYCSSGCKTITINGPYCGDGNINAPYEECDGESNCNSECKWEEDECNVIFIFPTAGWYGEAVPIKWEYSASCNIQPDQDLSFDDGNSKKIIQTIKNSWQRNFNWHPSEEGEGFKVCMDTELKGSPEEVEGCSEEFNVDLTAPTIISSDRVCNEGETITLTASATDSLSGVDGSSWKWIIGGVTHSGNSASYLCEDGPSSDIVKVKVSDNVGNEAEKNIKIDIIENGPTCEDVAIRYSYSNSYETGIAIRPENGNWIEGEVNITEGNYEIKYFIDNKKEGEVKDVNIKLKIDNTLLLNYNKTFEDQTYNSLLFNSSEFCGSHTIYLEVEKENECNISDNYAQREIYVQCDESPQAYCGDGVVNQASEECDGESNCNSECKWEEEDDDSDSGGKRSLGSLIEPKTCEPNWECSAWSECSDGIMNRECYDTNKCETEYNQPVETNLCVESVIKESKIEENKKGIIPFISAFVLLLILLVLVLNMRK